MKGDLCDRPENERPSEWDDKGGLDEEGLGSGPLKPNRSPDGGSSSDSKSPLGGGGSKQIISSDAMSDQDDESGGIFAKCFGWLGFGTGGDQCLDQTSISPYEAERLPKQAEDNFYGGGACLLEIDYPAYNPPLFSSETILPPDK